MAASRMERLIAKRTAERHVRALRCALAAIRVLNEQGIKAYVIGSLATERSAILGTDLYEQTVALKGFRHVVNHNYGTTLKLDKVQENLAVLQQAYPQFVEAITSFEAAFSADYEADGRDEQSRKVPRER